MKTPMGALKTTHLLVLLALISPLSAYAEPEGTPQLGLTQGLDERITVKVDVLNAGETLVFCSSDDGLREPNIGASALDADPISPDGMVRSSAQRPQGRLNAEVAVYPPEPTPCRSDDDCESPIPGHAYRCFDPQLGQLRGQVAAPDPEELGECAYTFPINPTSQIGLGACYWGAEGIIWSELAAPNPDESAPQLHRLTTDTAGVWIFDFGGEEETLTRFAPPLHSTRYFQIEVETLEGEPASGGRVYTDEWILNGHQRENTTSGTFFAVKRVAEYAEVFAIELDGLDGFLYGLVSNRGGIDGRPDLSWCEYGDPAPAVLGEAFRCPSDGDRYITRREHPLYLNYPEAIAARPPPLEVGDATFNDEAGTASISPNGDGVQDVGVFRVDVNLPVTIRVIIDSNLDGTLEPPLDLVLRGRGRPGDATIEFNGLDPRTGDTPLPPGEYPFRVDITTAETHFPLADIEANDLGFLITHRTGPAAEERRLTPMHWSDTAVRYNQDLIGDTDVIQTPVNGSTLELPDGAAQRRRWVQPEFVLEGALVSPPIIFNTWVFGERQTVTEVGCRRCDMPQGRVIISDDDESGDPDGDGLGDDEEAILGTDPNNPDSDGDGLNDRLEAEGSTNPIEADSDGDGIDDGVEDANRNGRVDDGETDPTNPDTDDDGLVDGAEDRDGDGQQDGDESDPLNPDTDGDGIRDGDDPRPLSPEAEEVPDLGGSTPAPDVGAPTVSDAGEPPPSPPDGGLDRTRLSDFEVLGCDCSTGGESPGLPWWLALGLITLWRIRCRRV